MIASEIYELSITIEDERLVNALRQDGAKYGGTLEMDIFQREQIAIYEEWLRLGKLTQRREFKAFGTLLYKALFNRDVESIFQTMLETASQSGQRLRVQLSFGDKALDLADLSWEYLYCPKSERQEGFFFATHTDLILSHRIFDVSVIPTPLNPEQGPLRVLFVTSHPLDQPPLVAEPVFEAIQNLSEKLLFKVDKLDKLTLPSLLENMTACEPHVLHYMGRVRLNPMECTTDIAITGPDDKAIAWIRDREFAEFFFQTKSTPRLIILHLCESEDPNASFTSLASLLLTYSKIPAVVVIRYPMPVLEAISFYRSLYRDLARGESVDGAVQAARWRMTLDNPDAYDNRAFGVSRIFDISHKGIVKPTR